MSGSFKASWKLQLPGFMYGNIQDQSLVYSYTCIHTHFRSYETLHFLLQKWRKCTTTSPFVYAHAHTKTNRNVCAWVQACVGACMCTSTCTYIVYKIPSYNSLHFYVPGLDGRPFLYCKSAQWLDCFVALSPLHASSDHYHIFTWMS